MSITRNQYRLATINAARLQTLSHSKWFLNLIILKSHGINVYSRNWSYARLLREQLYAYRNDKEGYRNSKGSKQFQYYLVRFAKEYEDNARIFRARLKSKKY